MFVLKFFLLILFIWYLPVQSDNSIYKCVSVGDPHIYTWRSQYENLIVDNRYQDCYRVGYYPLIKNEYLHFKIKVLNAAITNFEIYFFDGISKTSFCLISSTGLNIIVHNSEQCQRNGIQWTIDRYGHYTVTRITYDKAGFHTIITSTETNGDWPLYTNIEAFLPQLIVSHSTGVCTLHDPYCLLNQQEIQMRRSMENDKPKSKTITTNDAQTACEIHADAFLTRTHRPASARSDQMNKTIASIIADCVKDVLLTGDIEIANGGINILLIEDLISGLDSIDAIQTAVNTGIQDGLVMVDQAAEIAQARISQLFDGATIETVEYSTETTTTSSIDPLIYLFCNIYQSIYIQTWHSKDQLAPPFRSCSGQATSFHLIKTNYIEYILKTDGLVIEQLTLSLFDESSTEICNVWMTNSTIGWSACVQNGIKPSFVRSATHETLTVHYSKAHLTTIVTRDIGIFAGRFVIESSLPINSAAHATGICSLLSSCTT